MTRLHLALLSSLALHTVALVAAGVATPQLSGQWQASLSVRLVSRQDIPASDRDKPTRAAHAQPAVPRNDTRMASDAPHTVSPARRAEPDATAKTDTDTAAPATGDPSPDAMSRIKAHLYTDLARHFDYPELARRRGWEGRVMVALNVASDGQLQQIRVARSSGFALLDESALQSLRQVDRLTAAVALLNGQRLAVQIPVIYRLQGEP